MKSATSLRGTGTRKATCTGIVMRGCVSWSRTLGGVARLEDE